MMRKPFQHMFSLRIAALAAAFALATVSAASAQNAGSPGTTRLPAPSTDQTQWRLSDPARLPQQEPAATPERAVQLVSAAEPAPTDAERAARLEKQVELLGKQVEVLQKMVTVLGQQQAAPPPASNGLDQLQTQTETLQARQQQAGRRDQELSAAVNDLNERMDHQERYGPTLPAPLKELFLSSGTNESPLSIYGQLVSNFVAPQDGPSRFEFEEFSPFLLLQLNDWILLETELGFGPDGVEVTQAQADFMLNDSMTAVTGRFLAPLGYFNERLHPGWINLLPDFPLMFRQVSPADYHVDGLQLRGSRYLGCSPVKMEYSLYVSNGLGLDSDTPDLTALANLQALKETGEVNNAKAFGGRLGIVVPEAGITAGISALFNGPYTPTFKDQINLWQADAAWRKGNWDVRAEFADMFQQAESFEGQNIRRRGMYAQVGYRPYDSGSRIMQNLETVFRYGYTNFHGIDAAALDLSQFDSLVDVPVDRNQYTIGVDYYFYPSLVAKIAYEINAEIGSVKFNDNMFLAQIAWGF